MTLTAEARSPDTATPTDITRLPLVVDLDGTLTPTDTLFEGAVGALRERPACLPALVLALARGRAALKDTVAREHALDVDHLPLREEFVAWLREQQAAGRTLVLATAADRSIAERLQQRLQLFSLVIASDGQRNLKGKAKLEEIRRQVGPHFVYAGDSRADLDVWRHASGAVLVGAGPGVARAARELVPVEREFPHAAPRLRTMLRAMRVHQWLKNTLLAVPLLTAYSFDNPMRVLEVVLAFIAFSLIASATYLGNDLWDLNSDRQHPRKRLRPFASGQLDIRVGCAALVLLLLAGLAVAASVSRGFLGWALVYLVTTTAYSWHLKRFVMLDVLVLAVLYTLRIIAGAVAIGVHMSSWLLAFSVFAFLSLALVKRCSELVVLRSAQRQSSSGRDYRVDDLAVLWPMGVAASVAAVVVFGLFISAPETIATYRTQSLLWIAALALVYWMSRLWIKTSRGEMHDDPVVYAVRDRGSRLTVAFVLACVLVARFVTLDLPL